MATRSRASSRSAGTRSGSRRATDWLALQTTWSDLGSGTARVEAQFTSAQLSPVLPSTIIRTVGAFGFAADADFILNQDIRGAIGGMVVTERARAAGINSLPRPVTEIADDSWFWHQSFFGFAEATAAGGDVMSGRMVMFDSRAKRKVETGDGIVFVLENAASQTVQFSLMLRMLVMKG